MEEKRTILVVDDEPELRDVIQMRAQDLGFTVITAENGEEALKKVRSEHIDLIICDVLMPVMDGFTFYKEIKKSDATKKIPVLILTARGKMEDTFKVMGVDDFITKPFNGKVLMDKVRQILSKANPSQPREKEISLTPVAASSSGTGKKVLIAGNDTAAVNSMASALRKQGCQVETVMSGEEVISQATSFIPALLIIDVLMKDFDSSLIIQMLKINDDLRKMTTITYSFFVDGGSDDIREISLSIDAASERCAEEGAREYLGRFNDGPFLGELQKAVQKL